MSFDAFGDRASYTGTQSAIGFTGNWTDPDTELLYLRARDYDPETGQFLTVDPLVDRTRQPYAYTGNSPVLLTDPSGLDARSDEEAQAKADAELYSRPYILRDMLLNMASAGLFGMQQSLFAGNDLWTSFNMAYNPVYAVIEGSTNAVEHYRNGESSFVVLMDVLQVAGGLAAIAGIGIGAVSAFRALRPRTLASGADDFTTVGRWMGDDELAQMLSTGRVVEARNDGRTFVANPANPEAFPAGTGNFVEFKVPSGSLKPAGKREWSVIPGPNVTTTRWGPPPTEMPRAICIRVVCVR